MNSRFVKFSLSIALFFLFVSTSNSYAQENQRKPKVRVSPKASVTQTIGFTNVTISYSRPGVKGRKIWGGLVPYDKVWRAGANEATRFTFSKDVRINGHKLAAGSYAFFTIPGKDKWTLIFNAVANQWGLDYNKHKDKDVLKIKVKPVENNFQEWLEYTFSEMNVQKAGKKNSAVVNLIWDKLRIPFTVETNTD